MRGEGTPADIDRHGSTGFGQAFTNAILDDWGGNPYEDLMKGLDAALANYPFLDGTRVAAAGGSYGGYMVDWMASQSKGRFKALVSHAGVYDITSKYGTTEELWFPEAEFKGTPWTSREAYERWSPHLRAADFGQYKTPTLVIAGELDFRVCPPRVSSSSQHSSARACHRGSSSFPTRATRS